MDEKKLKDNELEKEEITNAKEDKKEKKAKKDKEKEEMIRLAAENKVLKEEYLKSKAELENFKKRTNEEKIRDRKYASTNLIGDLLLPLDQLKKVVEMQTEDQVLKNFLIGFKMINDKIYQVLEEDGLKEIDALNKQFDPNYHYAVEKESNKELENGIILDVIHVGYMYKDRILRPAMVKVNEWSENNNENNE